MTPDEERRQQAISDGQRFLDQGSLSHNHLHFYQNLIDVCLRTSDAKGMLHYADALAKYTESESLPWSDFYIARGRLLAQTLGRDIETPQRLSAGHPLETARKTGLYFGTPELEALVKR